jgi:hypothetical protein
MNVIFGDPVRISDAPDHFTSLPDVSRLATFTNAAPRQSRGRTAMR